MLQKFDARNRDIVVNIGGNLMHRDDAGVSPFDSVVQGGDAVWEGLRLYDGRIFKLIDHLDRLRSSAQALAFSQVPAHEEIIVEIRRTLEANQMRDGVHIRLTLTRGVKVTSGMDPRLNQRGPTLIVLAEWKAPVYRTDGLSLVTSAIRRFPPDCLDPKIHHNNLVQSILAKIEANTAGADDALMLDTRGFVAETNATHVFIVDGSRPTGAGGGEGGDADAPAPAPVVRTPRTVACPEGITRSTVLEICAAEGIDAREEDLSLTQIYRADEMFCTGTMGELAAVTSVDGRVIGNATAGPMTKRLSELYAQRTAAGGYPILGEGKGGA
jgi:branched-chain amino acid aminotransferase